jgi:hypothetical protein
VIDGIMVPWWQIQACCECGQNQVLEAQPKAAIQLSLMNLSPPHLKNLTSLWFSSVSSVAQWFDAFQGFQALQSKAIHH